MMHHPWLQATKHLLVAIIWVGVLVFGISLSGNIAISGEGAPLVSLGIAAFIAAAVATAFILADERMSPAEAESKTTDAGKHKNDQRNVDPLSLLTDEDIAELREDIKHNLRLRLLEGQDGELSSLDALLAERDQQSRR